MNRRQILITVGCAVIATGALAFGRIGSSARKASPVPGLPPSQFNSQPAAVAATQPPTTPPAHVVYELLFKEVAAFKKRADEMSGRGQDASAVRNFHKNHAKLSDHEADLLDRTADDCVRALAKLEQKARAIIKAERARHPGGLLKQGEALPLPPAELKALERQRRDTVMAARDQLRAAMGDEAFMRFDQSVRDDVGRRIKPLTRASDQHQ
jgi:hypothetical protein